MVPKAGLEPARISTVDFESTASTDFATSALKGMRKRCGLYLSRAAMQATTRETHVKCPKNQRYRQSSSDTASLITLAAFCSGSASTLAHISCTISQESFSLPAAFSGICSSWMSSPY